MTVGVDRVLAALDAIEAGDHEHVEEILLGMFEDGPSEGRYSCVRCGLRFEFPGQLDAHERICLR